MMRDNLLRKELQKAWVKCNKDNDPEAFMQLALNLLEPIPLEIYKSVDVPAESGKEGSD